MFSNHSNSASKKENGICRKASDGLGLRELEKHSSPCRVKEEGGKSRRKLTRGSQDKALAI